MSDRPKTFNFVGVDVPEFVGCEHEWTRWLERHDVPGSGMHYIEPTLIGEFCERCGWVRIYRPKPEAA